MLGRKKRRADCIMVLIFRPTLPVILRSAAVITAVLLLINFAHAQEWREIATRCTQYGEALPMCAGKNSCPGWEWVASCTLHSGYQVTPEVEQRFNRCLAQIDRERIVLRMSNTEGNPIAQTLACTGVQQ
jgi:hypothetical protein